MANFSLDFKTDYTDKDIACLLSNKSFFKEPSLLDEAWLSCWLDIVKTKPHLFVFRKNQNVVGFCFIGFSKRSKLGINWQVAHLNQSGDQCIDQIWVEHNQLFVDDLYLDEFLCELTDVLYRSFNVREISISLASKPLKIESLCQNAALHSKDITTSYVKNLPDDANPDTLLSLLSKNTRSKLRGSIKKIEKQYGKLVVSAARNVEEQLQLFEQLGDHHKKKWGDTAEGSGFDNDSFVNFHSQLMHHKGKTSVLAVHSGDILLGIAYFILNADHVFFYCSGINDDSSIQRFKPGYLLHIYCMQYFADKHYLVYDFLGGESQYKKSLSDNTYSMYSYQIFKKDKIYTLASTLKSVMPFD